METAVDYSVNTVMNADFEPIHSSNIYILTHSSIQQFKNCRKAWYFRNVERLAPRLESQYRGIGTAIHAGLELGCSESAKTVYETSIPFPSTQEEADNLEVNKAIIEAMLDGYFAQYGKWFPDAQQFFTEAKFCVDIINPRTKAVSRSFKLSGKADGLAKINGRWWLVEYKTASQVGKSYIDKLMLDAQMTTYVYGLQKHLGITIDGIIYRILRKPSIRQTKKETVSQYLERLTEDYKARPNFYFFEEKLYRSQDDMKAFEQELWELTQDMLKCRRENLWYRNTSRCIDWGNCEYMALCCHKPDAMDMYVTREINSELTGGNEYAITDIKDAS